MGQEWKNNGTCQRQMGGNINLKPTFVNSHFASMDLVSLFRLFFPFTWFESVLLRNINDHIEGEKVSLGELLRWIGIWFLMACCKGFPRHEFWSSKDVDAFDGAPWRFCCSMSRNRFDIILKNMRYTDRAHPTYRDKFNRVRHDR
jgi:hypothetical protein